MSQEPQSKAGAMNRIREAVLSGSKRSSLHKFLIANRTEFAALLKEAGRPDWGAIAKACADEGLKDGAGNKPSAETTRQTWWKVTKEFGKDPSQPLKARAQSAPLSPPPVLLLKEPGRGGPKSRSQSQPATDEQSAEDALAALREQMRKA